MFRFLPTTINHFILLMGLTLMIVPVWIIFASSTHTSLFINTNGLQFFLGDSFKENYSSVLFKKAGFFQEITALKMFFNSFVMAMGIATLSVVTSLMAAYGLVYFKIKYATFIFWLIFITLMLPVEVRIIPTFEVVSNLGMLNSYAGLSIPLIASATATFMFRQVFMTIPDELIESSKLDGAGPLKFFFDFLVPLSRTNIAALFVILFIYGWNQYLWPLLITTDRDKYTIVMSIKQMIEAAEQTPEWHIIMMTSLLAMLPPILVVLTMQKLFVKGLIESEK